MADNIDNNNLWVSIPGAENLNSMRGLDKSYFRCKDVTLHSKASFTTTKGTYTNQGGNNIVELSFNDINRVNTNFQNLITNGGIIAQSIIIVQGYEKTDGFIIESKFTIGDINNPVYVNLGREGCFNNQWFSTYVINSSLIKYEFIVIDADGTKEGAINGSVGS